MPYNQFITWQLAGDLLPKATSEQILATGFNRNHQQNMEGGIIPEEFRVEYVADRTNTLGKAFLGLTTECARCHDHKYDPISQKNYYELFSFFNNVQEAGQISWDNATPVPTMLLTDDELEKKISFIKNLIIEKESDITKIEDDITQGFEEWFTAGSSNLMTLRNLPKGFTAYFDLNHNTITNQVAPYQKGCNETTACHHPTLPKNRRKQEWYGPAPRWRCMARSAWRRNI